LGNFLGDLFAKYQVTLVYRLFWSQLCFAKIASQLKKNSFVWVVGRVTRQVCEKVAQNVARPIFRQI
jgi:hypothetical protein